MYRLHSSDAQQSFVCIVSVIGSLFVADRFERSIVNPTATPLQRWAIGKAKLWASA
ncbi:hypothetical protein [Pseudorhizobium marinum]|uniref:hypothetical protein n=1 Tax=Pseudorhizobium marinum TaxID=1496690 RepID=UPI000A6C681C|nr:hypothetical protein [Pseudorhizobium marinum]